MILAFMLEDRAEAVLRAQIPPWSDPTSWIYLACFS